MYLILSKIKGQGGGVAGVIVKDYLRPHSVKKKKKKNQWIVYIKFQSDHLQFSVNKKLNYIKVLLEMSSHLAAILESLQAVTF